MRVWWGVAVLFALGCGGRTELYPPAADAGIVDAVPPETSVVDVEPDVDVAGIWQTCGHTLTLASDHTWQKRDADTGCVTSGSWTIAGHLLDLDVDTSSCAQAPASTHGVQVLRGASGGLILVAADQSQTDYLPDSAPRTRWQLQGQYAQGGGGTTIARIVGAPGKGLGTGCYWSADGACGGLFSCGGRFTEWLIGADGTLTASAACTGDCPCGAQIAGTISQGTHLAGTFTHSNCGGTSQGTLTGDKIPDP